MHSDHISCKARKRKHQERFYVLSSVLFKLYSGGCNAWLSYLGGISLEIFCPHQGTKLSWLASPHTREALEWDFTWTRKGMEVPRPGDHMAAPPSALSTGERGPQLTIHAGSDIRWPAGSFQSYLFLCSQNNGYAHQPRINTIHLESSPLWLETRGTNSFSIETTMNADVVPFPKDPSPMFVCGQVCRSIYIHQFPLSNVH